MQINSGQKNPNNMQETFMSHLPAEQRVGYLQSQADVIETSTHYRSLEEEEVQQVREDFVKNANEVRKIKKEAAEKAKDYKDSVAEIEDINSQLMEKSLTKSAEIQEKIYGISDRDKGIMTFYNAKGIFIKSRRLLPEERQLSFEMGNTAEK